MRTREEAVLVERTETEERTPWPMIHDAFSCAYFHLAPCPVLPALKLGLSMMLLYISNQTYAFADIRIPCSLSEAHTALVSRYARHYSVVVFSSTHLVLEYCARVFRSYSQTGCFQKAMG